MDNNINFKKELYSIYDKVTCMHIYIFTAYNENDALRVFHGSCQRGTTLYSNPLDYQLFHLGHLDEQTGTLYSSDKKVIANYLIRQDIQQEIQITEESQ